jgi:uncharacterized damage-inducible protein DinB
MNPERWVKREFKLGVPLEMFPNILERLRGTPARLEDRLLNLPSEVLTHKEGDAWSIQEHAGHLLDLGTLDHGRLDDFEAGVEMLRPADMGNRKTYEAEHNKHDIREILAEFRQERGAFVQRLESCDDAFIARQSLHPRLKQPMRVVDLAFFIAEHDDHHLARITETLKRSF